jgi:hypothetical protein
MGKRKNEARQIKNAVENGVAKNSLPNRTKTAQMATTARREIRDSADDYFLLPST